MSEEMPKKLTNKFTYIFAVSGIFGAIVWNGLKKQLWYHGIYKHTMCAAIGAFTGTKYGEWTDRRMRRRDYILYEYMDRHPEDFKKPPVKPMGEYLEQWKPIR